MLTTVLTVALVGLGTLGRTPADDKEAYLPPATEIGHHTARYDAQGKILPWLPWEELMDREMAWYAKCPLDKHGYPIVVFTTFMDGDYKPYKQDTIPCTLNGMGIISCLKYWEFKERKADAALALAKKFGDYLITETLTPDKGPYSKFTRSTGYISDFPLTRSSQHDEVFGPNVIEPDKGGIAGYALVTLFEATGDARYLAQGLHNARLLAKHQRRADALHAPWPFRVDSVTGEHWGEKNADMVFILRLYDELIAQGHKEFQKKRDALWDWIKTYQIPSPDAPEGNLWIQFFEDHHEEDNRVSWAPLEMARYLIEKKEALDENWKLDVERLLGFVQDHLATTRPSGAVLAVEQDHDKRPWGGVSSKMGGVMVMFGAAGGGEHYLELGFRALNWATYAVADDGCPNDMAMTGRDKRGGWQEDAFTDVMHNYIDAMVAVPAWRGNGMLK